MPSSTAYRRRRVADGLYAVVRQDGSEAGRCVQHGEYRDGSWTYTWRAKVVGEWLSGRDLLSASVLDVAAADRESERGGMER